MSVLRQASVRRSTALLLAATLVISSSPEEAHLMTTGLGTIYDEISHFLISPEDLVPAFVLALLAGQNGPEAGRKVLFILPASWLAGGLWGLAFRSPPLPDLTWVSFILLGGLVAAKLRLLPSVIGALALVLGLLHGFLNGATMGIASAGLGALFGIAATVFVVESLVAATVVAFTWQPARIAFRVLGSWTAATGILLLGWSLR